MISKILGDKKSIITLIICICLIVGYHFGMHLYKQSQKIVLGDDMKAAITEMAMSYENFYSDEIPKYKDWKEYFISTFIQNSRFSCKYLTEAAKKNNGIINVKDINYIHKSLTGVDIDFSDIAGEGIDCNASSSKLNRGILGEYDSEPVVDGGVLKGVIDVESDGEDNIVEKRRVSTYLVKNPDSCFDGLSIRSLYSEKIPSERNFNNEKFVFYGTNMETEDEEDDICTVEFTGKEGDLSYKHFVALQLAGKPELLDFVRKNIGKELKITFTLDGKHSDIIDEIVPDKIELNDNWK